MGLKRNSLTLGYLFKRFICSTLERKLDNDRSESQARMMCIIQE